MGLFDKFKNKKPKVEPAPDIKPSVNEDIMEGKNYIQATIKEFGNRHPEIKLTSSAISDYDIAELEMKLHVTIPNAVKDYLQSYSLSVPFVTGKMLGDFSYTYCEEAGRWRELEI